MREPENLHSATGLLLVSQVERSPGELFSVEELRSKWDLALIAPSWDSRCLSLSEEGAIPAERVLCLRYKNPGSSGLQRRHAEQIDEWLRASHVTVENLTGASEDTGNVWALIRQQVSDSSRDLRRPITMLVDLSVIPRVFSLGILGDLVASGLVDELTLVYTEGLYDLANVAARESVFTSGRWKSIAVPGFLGRYRPSRPRTYLVSLGFDGDDTYRTINSVEPNTVGAVLADPAVSVGLERTALERNKLLLEDWVYEENLIRVGATDVLGMSRAVATVRSGWGDSNFHLLCVGSKPHALGMAIAAFGDRDTILVYRVPERHREVATRRTSRLHRFDVRRRVSLGPLAYSRLLAGSGR